MGEIEEITRGVPVFSWLSKSCGGLLALFFLLVFLDALSETGTDYNPTVTPPEIVGKWVAGHQSLALNADGTYEFSQSSQADSGAWRLNDFTLHLDGHSQRWRVINVRGELVIIKNYRGPDLPAGKRFYRRIGTPTHP